MGAGRPALSYKYTNPINGKPITAIMFHKIVKNIQLQLQKSKKVEDTRAEILLGKVIQFTDNLLLKELELR